MKRPPTAFAGSAGSPAEFPRDGLPEVAFLGRSNVGKSSLLNALTGARKLARVSSTPGRTQVVNFFRVGHELYLVDLPGYGYARVPEEVRQGWEGLVTSYLVGREPLALCVFIVDARHEAMEGDDTLKAWLDDQGLAYVVAATKVDKLGRGEIARRVAALGRWAGEQARGVVAVSSTRGDGIEALWTAIRGAADEARARGKQGA